MLDQEMLDQEMGSSNFEHLICGSNHVERAHGGINQPNLPRIRIRHMEVPPYDNKLGIRSVDPELFS